MDPAIKKKHLRYLAQSGWTKPFREFLYRRLPKDRPISMLEVGCGTGALIGCVKKEFPGRIGLFAGADLDRYVLDYAKNNTELIAVQADGMELPFINGFFDFVFCHYLILWTNSPEHVIKEMKRVTRSGGLCAAMAEPDYGEMTAEPESLKKLAHAQIQALTRQGANLYAGHCLEKLFQDAGFRNCQAGSYQRVPIGRDFLAQEIAQMAEDCGAGSFETNDNVDYIYHVPTYYAYAVK